MDVDGDEKAELANFKSYYDQNEMKHRLMFREEKEKYEDSMLECVQHIYDKGLKEDIITYDDQSIVGIAISSGNTKVALWLINNLCDGEIPNEIFDNADDLGNTSAIHFVFDLCNFFLEVDYLPILEIMLKRCCKENLTKLLDQKSNMLSPIMHFVSSKPGPGFYSPDSIAAYENDLFMKYLNILLEIAQKSGHDIATPVQMDKNQAYNMSNPTQEKVNKIFENVDEEAIDKRVNSFGLINLEANENELVYFDTSSGLQEYQCQQVKSNLLHKLVESMGQEFGGSNYDDY